MRILFYGDSNTWGYNSLNASRYENRYPVLVQQAYCEHTIIEEGLCGRCLCHDDPYDFDRNGIRTISMVIKSHMPLDIIFVLLGTNDAKRMYSTNIYSMDKALRSFIDEMLKPSLYRKFDKRPKICILSPIRMNTQFKENPSTLANFGHEGFDILEHSHEVFKSVCQMMDVEFLDISDVVRASEFDGVHLDEKGHQALAKVIIEKIGELQ